MGELSRWAKFNHKGSYKKKAGGNVTLETDGSVVAMRQGRRAAFWLLGEERDGFRPGACRIGSAHTSILAL